MKRQQWHFILSLSIALGIAVYARFETSVKLAEEKAHSWKTFVKKPGREIASHSSTPDELADAKIPLEKNKKGGRKPSSFSPLNGYMMRNGRVLIGEIERKYEDPEEYLSMSNTINPQWKEIMGRQLMRFQQQGTKLIVKEENSAIKIEDGQGKFLEQVAVTYLFKSGERNSFRALVDSETGMVLETWDRTLHEKVERKREKIPVSTGQENGIVAR